MSPAKVRILRLLLASGAMLMSSVVIEGETVGVAGRSSGDGGAAKRAGGSVAATGGGGRGAVHGAGGAGATRACRMMFVEPARAISWFC